MMWCSPDMRAYIFCQGIICNFFIIAMTEYFLQDRDLGLRSSCTTDNLVRSPSVAGTNGGRLADDLDEANTDYAESDVMLGGGNTSNSNGSNERGNGNSKQNTIRFEMNLSKEID